MPAINLFVGTPMYGGMAAVNFITSFVNLQRDCANMGMPCGYSFIGNEALITRARNEIAHVFLQSNATHLLWCDADIGFEPGDIFKMIGADKDIVGAACPRKSLNWDRIQKVIRANPGRDFTHDELMNVSGDLVVPGLGPQDPLASLSEPVEVQWLGTGLLLVQREVFLKIQQRFPDRYYTAHGGHLHEFFTARTDPATREYLSEDLAFCLDARSAGCSVWLAPWVNTSHFGGFRFYGSMAAIANQSPIPDP